MNDALLETPSTWNDIVDLSFPRKKEWSSIDELEEEERKWRISRKVDPVLFGKWHQIQSELKSFNWGWRFKSNFPSLSVVKDVAAEKAHGWTEFTTHTLSNLTHSTTDTISNLSHSLTHATSEKIGNLTHTVLDKAYEFVEVAKDKLGMSDPSSIASINKAEEHERLRRINDSGIDPVLDGHKRKVEDELLHRITKAT